MKRLLIIHILACLPILSGCVAGEQVHLNKKTARIAYDRARSSMLAEEEVYSDVLWAMIQIHEKDHDLQSFVNQSKKHVFEPFYMPGVFPSLPRIDLPLDLGHGIRRFFTCAKVPFGQPTELAMTHLESFITEENSGYILTHQYFCLVWAEQSGLPLTQEMLRRKDELFEKVYNEQLQQAYETVQVLMRTGQIFGGQMVMGLIQDPQFDPVREDREFQAFVDRFGGKELREEIEELARKDQTEPEIEPQLVIPVEEPKK